LADNRELSLRPGSTVVGYLQLVRLPNVFTAVADVLMGFLFTHATFAPGAAWILGLLIAASVLLYMAGMVLNDVFDVEVDTRERPKRPIPSGRVSLSTARWVGWQLLVAGAIAGWLAGYRSGDLRPGLVATALAACVLLYDAGLKKTLAGPLGMGACRTLNVLLGMSLSAQPWQAEHALVAGAIGVYIAGVTWFARGEADRSRRAHLAGGMLVMLAGVGLLSLLPGWSDRILPLIQQQPMRWGLLMIIVGLIIMRRCLWAITNPTPARVQATVKQSLISLVILDAAVAFAVRGPLGALAVLVLLVPMMLLGARFYST